MPAPGRTAQGQAKSCGVDCTHIETLELAGVLFADAAPAHAEMVIRTNWPVPVPSSLGDATLARDDIGFAQPTATGCLHVGQAALRANQLSMHCARLRSEMALGVCGECDAHGIAHDNWQCREQWRCASTAWES